MRKTSILLASAVYLIGHTLAAAQQPYTPCDELSAFQKFVRGGCGDFKGNIGSGDGNGLFREAKDRENDKDDDVTSPGKPTDPGDGDDGDDNGHGNDDDHDDDSNPGQGGGHHGGDKPGKGGGKGGKGPGRGR